MAQSAAATRPVRRPKKTAVNRKMGKTVREPMTTLGRRMAASSLMSVRKSGSASGDRRAFHACATLTETKMSVFITIGCSAFSVKSPRA